MGVGQVYGKGIGINVVSSLNRLFTSVVLHGCFSNRVRNLLALVILGQRNEGIRQFRQSNSPGGLKCLGGASINGTNHLHRNGCGTQAVLVVGVVPNLGQSQFGLVRLARVGNLNLVLHRLASFNQSLDLVRGGSNYVRGLVVMSNGGFLNVVLNALAAILIEGQVGPLGLVAVVGVDSLAGLDGVAIGVHGHNLAVGHQGHGVGSRTQAVSVFIVFPLLGNFNLSGLNFMGVGNSPLPLVGCFVELNVAVVSLVALGNLSLNNGVRNLLANLAGLILGQIGPSVGGLARSQDHRVIDSLAGSILGHSLIAHHQGYFVLAAQAVAVVLVVPNLGNLN